MELISTDKAQELESAISLVLEWLEEENAHTIGALLEWHYGGGWKWPDEKMLRAYKAAQLEVFGTQ